MAFILRIYGLNWDQNQHLHPDERFLTMVTEGVKWPTTFSDYLDSRKSTLNPYNVGYNFFVYGTFPLTLNKFFSGIIAIDEFDYNNITLVGRFISALFDLGIVVLVYKIGKIIFKKEVGIIASFFYAISVLPIQLSHFFAVETFLVFFIILSFYFLILFLDNKNPLLTSILIGVSFGLSLSCKISAILFLPIIASVFLFYTIKYKNFMRATYYILLTTLFSYLAFRIADPHAFIGVNIFNPRLNPIFIDNLRQLKAYDNPDSLFPPGIQWVTTKPLLFPLKNMIFWGLGLPLGIISVFSVLSWIYKTSLLVLTEFKKMFKFASSRRVEKLGNVIKNITSREYCHFLLIFWTLFVFFYEGIQYSKTMRYFYPIYPFLAIISANFVYHCTSTLVPRTKNKVFLTLFYSSTLLLLLIWPLSFVQIYSRPHSRVTASEWIYKNIPPGSSLSCEYWDDCLPLPTKGMSYQSYKIETLTLYDPDTETKWSKVNSQLKNIDYLILSSNRLWGSIPKVPEKYPIASKFYNDLFAGKLQFTKVAEFTSYPTIPFLNIPIPDDSAEEAFTVYDHPEVYIFKNSNKINTY